MQSTICLILGGGQGSRLFPLTKDRSKSAVPIGGKYRLIDFPVSASLNSGVNRILILTQFNSASLNAHINRTYRFDNFHDAFVDVLAAEQTRQTPTWHQGTADAVRRNMKHIEAFRGVKYVLVISGDQIHNLDFRSLLDFHRISGAKITLAATPCDREAAQGFGILQTEGPWIRRFEEKPRDPVLLEAMESRRTILRTFPDTEEDKRWIASMGIYLFNLDTLHDLMGLDFKDFGKEVIPYAIQQLPTAAFLFKGYWEDVGTIHSFWKANLDFTARSPVYDLFHRTIYTRSRNLPPCRLDRCQLDETLVCDGVQAQNAQISRSVLGIRSMIGPGVEIRDTYMMGADYFDSDEDLEKAKSQGTPPLGIGEGTKIHKAIIDKNARVGKHCQLVNFQQLEHKDAVDHYIRDGIIIIPKGAVIPDGTVI